jgi:methylated-DNA-[protein]-cysteine S-methyltransferase
MISIDEVPSPIGPLTIAERSGRVCLVHFGGEGAEVDTCLERWHPGEPRVRRRIEFIRRALDAYFAGDCRALDRVPVEFNGTPFQRKVWEALRDIPAGATLSYADLARRIGEPRAVRAVGAANGANPIAVIVPCHRVIGADGTLTGYGGGLDRKQWLLAHEGVLPRLPL